MREYFEGYYFKHQKDSHTLCVIAGQSGEDRFIQIITNDFSAEFPFTEGNFFSKKGIRLNINTPELTLKGAIRYHDLSPIKYDIMGPFALLPMECSHGIVSMRHHLEGKVRLNGEVWDFTGGLGYIEKDSGCSFPSSYVWIQANDFEKPTSIMAAVAEIPLCTALRTKGGRIGELSKRLRFRGCICVIQFDGKEYRLATYLGVRIRTCSRDKIVLTQGKYRLEIRVKCQKAHDLSAPQQGQMNRTIREAAACPAEFRFYVRGKRVFLMRTKKASFEWEGECVEKIVEK